MKVLILSRSVSFDHQWYVVRSNGKLDTDNHGSQITDKFTRLVPPHNSAAIFLQGQMTEGLPAYALLLTGLYTERQDIGNRDIRIFLFIESQDVHDICAIADHFIGHNWPLNSDHPFFPIAISAVDSAISGIEHTRRHDDSVQEIGQFGVGGYHNQKKTIQTYSAGQNLLQYLESAKNTGKVLPRAGKITGTRAGYSPLRIEELLSWISHLPARSGSPTIQALVVAPWKTASPEVRGWDDRWDKVPIVIYIGGPSHWQNRERKVERPQEIILSESADTPSSRIQQKPSSPFTIASTLAAGAIAIGTTIFGGLINRKPRP